MKYLILTIVFISTLISCNKEDLRTSCNCEVTHQNFTLGEWYTDGTHDGDWNLYPIVTDTLIDCELGSQINYITPTYRQVITCD